ncbi:hypothetical protein DRJ48_02040 [Candidatus Woesearchaeota archaeon]|nr:hypothetical protein [Candidatus Woesearchaeota archaeon]RLE43020.1 MAG: hypothetical protein DRJ48_02040 [Candidatus Woesearchaeota archaeon]
MLAVVVLPLYATEQKQVEHAKIALARLSKVKCKPKCRFIVLDDGSPLQVAPILEKTAKGLSLDAKVVSFKKNLGYVEVMKQGYKLALSLNPSFIIKADMDLDFHQGNVLGRYLPLLQNGKQLLVSKRVPELLLRMNPYEFKKRQELKSQILAAYGFDVDPASAGCFGFSHSVLSRVLSHPFIVNYSKQWGLDFAIVSVALLLGIPVDVIKLPGRYDKERRPREKVDAQYEAYYFIINWYKKAVTPRRGS